MWTIQNKVKEKTLPTLKRSDAPVGRRCVSERGVVVASAWIVGVTRRFPSNQGCAVRVAVGVRVSVGQGVGELVGVGGI